MTGRRAIVGLCMLCALAFSAIMAQAANAESNGLTLFTCKEVTPAPGTAGFSKAHCKESDAVSTEAKYEHVAIAENTTTNITGTTVDTEGKPTPSRLKATISGIETELVSPLAHIHPEVEGKPTSWVTNAKEPATGVPNPNEHYFHGEAQVDYTEVEVAKPAGKGCKVKGGTVTTNKLKFSSTGTKEHTVKFEPASGPTGLFAEFTVEGCSVGALNGPYEVKGSVEGVVDGSTLTFTHAQTTAQALLTVRAQKAGFESTTTIKGTDFAAGDKTDTPLSATTVPTP